MDMVFLIVILLSYLYSLATDLRELRKKGKKVRRTYFVLAALTLFFYVLVMFRIELPMPTQYIARHVAPWVYSLVKL